MRLNQLATSLLTGLTYLIVFLISAGPATANPVACGNQQILTTESCLGDGLDSEESKLYQLLNTYRAQNGLPAIPSSPSLNLVANRHVRDLEGNLKQLSHGWSDCAYSSSKRDTWPCMWEAPQRLGTDYPGNGFENAFGSAGADASAETAINSWKNSGAHNAVILNKDVWSDYNWNAMGIGIYGGYAVLWVGDEIDPEDTPTDTAMAPPPIPTAASLPQTGAPSMPTVNGENVDTVLFATGSFLFLDGTQWVETGNGQDRFQFEEVGYDEWSVYLHDRSRDVAIQLDLHTRIIMYSSPIGSEAGPLYPITSATASNEP